MKVRGLFALATVLLPVTLWTACTGDDPVSTQTGAVGQPCNTGNTCNTADLRCTDGFCQLSRGSAPADASAGDINGGFEVGSLGCGTGWTGNARIELVKPGRNGSFACRVCNGAAERTVFSVETELPGRAGTWMAQAYFRIVPGKTAPVQAGITIDAVGSPDTPFTFHDPQGDWTPVTSSVVATPDASTVTITIAGDGDPNSCIDIDDVAVASP